MAERSQQAAAEITSLSSESVQTAEEAGQMLDGLVPDIQKTVELVNIDDDKARFVVNQLQSQTTENGNKVAVSIDGEVVKLTIPLSYKINPKSLRLIIADQV